MQEKPASTIAQFCADHNISRPTFYNLVAAGRGPRIMKVGSKSLISTEAAADWRRQMEIVDPELAEQARAHAKKLAAKSVEARAAARDAKLAA